ncbi:MAG: LacI family DNA-binding transcriptional regulator [Nocardioidaceae bacterium]
MRQRSGEQAGPTIAQVARAAGVSRQTVSNALNAPDRLRADTLQRVLGVVDELGYRPNRAARNLRRRESQLVGLRINPADQDRAGSLLDRFLHALVEHSVGAGYHILLFTPRDPDDELAGFDDLLRTTAVDAFVLTDTHRGDPRLHWLGDRDAPFVAFGRPWEDGLMHPWVDVDGAVGTGLAVDHLVALGHRRIGLVGWPEDSDVGQDRRRGWLDACVRHGIADPDLRAHCTDRTDEAMLAAGRLLDGSDPPTALVCVSDTLAMGVLGALAERGLRAGRDVAVTGFDDSPAAAVVPPGLTSVRQPLEDVAESIVKRLGALLSDEPLAERGELLTPTLVVRGTTDHQRTLGKHLVEEDT